MQSINLEPQQVLRAATAGVQLLNTPGAVNVPSQMAITGDVAVLNALLSALVRQEVIIVNAPPQPATGDQPPPPGNGEVQPKLEAVEGE